MFKGVLRNSMYSLKAHYRAQLTKYFRYNGILAGLNIEKLFCKGKLANISKRKIRESFTMSKRFINMSYAMQFVQSFKILFLKQ